MKKSITINLKGVVFNIDEDAYKRLNEYLDSIRRFFSSYEGSEEIIEDIESRITEIFLERLKKEKREIIIIKDIEDVIARMGRISDFEDESANEEETTNSYKSYKSTTRLFKDNKRRIISGVASGIANYFKIDPAWIRLLFLVSAFTGGIGILVYIILIVVLPSSDNLSDIPTKRLFRNPDDVILGGVASGLAKYLAINPVILRMLFIASIFLGGMGVLIYLILWIVLPDAKTVSEKMQMEGEVITLSNIEKKIKESFNLKDENGEEKTFAKILFFPFRLIAQIVLFLGKILNPLIKVFALIIRMVLAFAFLMTAIWLIIITVVVFFIGNASIVPDLQANFFIDSISQAMAYVVSVFLFLTATIFGFLSFNIGLKVAKLGYKGWAVLIGLWAVSIGALIGISALEISKYSSEGEFIVQSEIPISNNTLILDAVDAGRLYYQGISLNIRTHEDSTYVLKQVFKAYGSSNRDAVANAKMIKYNYLVKDSLLIFDSNMDFVEDAKFRVQQIEMTLYVPENKPIRLSRNISEILDGFSVDDKHVLYDFAGHTWVGKNNIFYCHNCNDLKQVYSSDQESIELNVKEGFNAIEFSSIFQYEIQQSDEYKVVVVGDEKYLKLFEYKLDDNNIEFKLKGRKIHKTETNEGIKVHIFMPYLYRLETSGLAKGKVLFENLDHLDAQLSGASELDLEVSQIETLDLELSGISKVRLFGKADDLNIEISGGSKVKAFNLKSKKAYIEANGIANVCVYVSDRLKVSSSGATSIEYMGNPKVKTDVSGLSTLTHVN